MRSDDARSFQAALARAARHAPGDDPSHEAEPAAMPSVAAGRRPAGTVGSTPWFVPDTAGPQADGPPGGLHPAFAFLGAGGQEPDPASAGTDGPVLDRPVLDRPLLDRLVLDPGAIAAELALSPDMDEEAIRAARRRFALANHPDRLPAACRSPATRRMAIANRLVEDALAAKRAGRPAPGG